MRAITRSALLRYSITWTILAGTAGWLATQSAGERQDGRQASWCLTDARSTAQGQPVVRTSFVCNSDPPTLDSHPASGYLTRMVESYLALQVIMMPKDANPIPTLLPGNTPNHLYMTIFGGVILSYIDQAGAIGARHEVVKAGGPLPMVVTVAMNRVEFHQPVLVGDVVRFLTRLVRMGRTSITMQVSVEAERG